MRLIKEEMYEGFISGPTIEEVLKAPERIQDKLLTSISDVNLTVLEETEESINLSGVYVREGAIPEKYR